MQESTPLSAPEIQLPQILVSLRFMCAGIWACVLIDIQEDRLGGLETKMAEVIDALR